MVTQKIHRLFFYLLIFQLLGLAGPVPEPEMQAARHQLRKSKLQLHVSFSEPLSLSLDASVHTHALRAAPVANPTLPSHSTPSVTLVLDWHTLDEGVRGNYVSRAFQTHNFPKHMDIWEKNNLLLNGSFGFCKCVFSTVSCSTS